MPSLVVVTMVAGFGAAMIQMQSGITLRQKQAVDNKRALYVAEAGLAEAFLALVHGKSGNVASAQQPAAFGGGVYWVEAEDIDGSRIALTSNGLCGAGRFSAALVVEKQANSLASLGLFGDQEVIVGRGCVVDGYDSALGSFDSQAQPSPAGPTTQQGGTVNSNGTLWVEGGGILGLLGPNTTVYGNARPGKSSIALVEPGATVTGSTTPNPSRLPLPAIAVPPLDAAERLEPPTSATTEVTGDRHYESIRVGGGARLVLKGPTTLAAGELRVETSGQLVLDSREGPVIVHVTGSTLFDSGSTLANVGADPRAVALVVGAAIPTEGGGDPQVRLEGSGTFYGLLYAPRSELVLPQGLRVFGTVAARKLELADGCRTTFDRSLVNADGMFGGLPLHVSWRIVGLPDVPIVTNRRDPLVTLKLANVTPLKSADAHMEKLINITYRDALGNLQTYSGPASLLDWSLVKKCVSKVWSIL